MAIKNNLIFVEWGSQLFSHLYLKSSMADSMTHKKS